MKARAARFPRHSIMLALLFVGLVLAGTGIGWLVLVPKQKVAIDIGATVLLKSRPSPSLASLASLGFTDVGTDAEPQDWLMNSTVQSILHQWIQEAHQNRLRTFAMIGQAGSAFRSAELDFKIGFDYVEFDEFISEEKLPLDALRNMASSLTMRYSTQILLTEYRSEALATAALLASQVRGVMIASDNYVDRNSLFQIYRIGRIRNIDVAAWLIFYPDSPNKPEGCYNDLQRWMQDTSQLGLNIYFFIVDPDGLWKEKWPMIQAFLESRQSLLATLRIVGIGSWISICVAAFLPFLPDDQENSKQAAEQ